MHIRTLIVECFTAACCLLAGNAAAEGRLAEGEIFGIQLGEPISMSPSEVKMAGREHSNTFVRTVAQKPADVRFLQVFVTPITHTVWSVQGKTEFRDKKAADAFVAKYVKVLPGLSDAFSPSYDTAEDTPLKLTSPEWILALRVVDLKKMYGRTGGYLVSMDMSAAFGGKAHERISELQRVERSEERTREQRRAVNEARANGGLQGLR
ncbi:hypothetical protein [Massilia sp. CT11-137]|uniref:hypothetical protein n=1 Tax=Massilia sp. CT11-137 TaxID=3393901 RepID=UPI0039AFE9A9